jgi:molybdate transport system substrate-binding protein
MFRFLALLQSSPMWRIRFQPALVLLLGLMANLALCARESVSVAAAADLQFALPAVVSAFAKLQPEAKINVTYGSSGNFYAQIVNGAPFDLFLSADEAYPQKLVEAGVADGKTAFRYSRGRLVLWVRNDSPIHLEHLGMRALADPSVKRVAIANPIHAPYGRAATSALGTLGLLSLLKPRLVLGENISQTAQFVQSGAADIGILALSLAKAPALSRTGRSFEVPLNDYPPLNQGAVLLMHARGNRTAHAFFDFLRGGEGQALLASYGFIPGAK